MATLFWVYRGFAKTGYEVTSIPVWKINRRETRCRHVQPLKLDTQPVVDPERDFEL